LVKRVALACFLAILAPLAAFSPSMAAESLFERAKNLYDIHEYRLSLVLFERVIAQDPDNGEAWDFASWCNRYLGNFETARQGFEKAEQLLPGKLAKWVKVGLGETYLGAGAYESAALAFNQAIELDPEDEELVVRSRKGLALADAGMMDSAAMEETLKKLSETAVAVADEIRAEAADLLAKREQAVREEAAGSGDQSGAAQAVSGDAITDANERNAQILATVVIEPGGSELTEPDESGESASEEQPAAETATVVSEPGEEQPAAETATVVSESGEEQPSPEEGESTESEAPQATGGDALIIAPAGSVWDAAILGAPISDVLSRLKGGGISAQKVDEQTSLGSWFYVLSFQDGAKPPIVRENDADSVLCVLEEYDGRLLSVTVTSVWESRKSNISMKDALFKETREALNEKIQDRGKFRDTGLSTESQWIYGESQLIVLTGVAGLDGKIILETVCNDLPGLKVFLENAKKINAERQ
jgi:lipoprotein NlpI